MRGGYWFTSASRPGSYFLTLQLNFFGTCTKKFFNLSATKISALRQQIRKCDPTA
jgi:hypothetical protein